MIDPKELINAGIKIYKANQRPREYVCTFFKVPLNLMKVISCRFFSWIQSRISCQLYLSKELKIY